MEKAKFYDLNMLGAHITRYCTACATYRLMVDSMNARAEVLKKKGITNPMPALIKELNEMGEQAKLERMEIDSCLASLGMGALPDELNETNLPKP